MEYAAVHVHGTDAADYSKHENINLNLSVGHSSKLLRILIFWLTLHREETNHILQSVLVS